MSIAPEDIIPSFDSNARKYRCCFGCCWHVRVCAKIIGSLESVCVTIAFISSLIAYIHHHVGNMVKPQLPEPPSKRGFGHEILDQNVSKPNETHDPIQIISSSPDVVFAVYVFFFVLVWIAVILLFYGVNNVRPKCLLPHLFLQVLCVLYSLVMTVVYAVQQGKWSVLTFPARPALIIYSIGCIFEIYFFVSIVRCYRYLKAKRRAAPISRCRKHLQALEEGGAGYPS